MRITELLEESQQLDEGPFTQAVGKVGGKIAKGVANIGKDLKTGFKAGYSGEQPPAAAAAPRDPDVPMNPKTGKPLTEPERKAHQDAGGQFDGETGDPLPLGTKATNPDYNPAKKAGGGFIDQFKKGFAQGRGEPAADTTTAPAATTSAPAADAAPSPAADAAPAPAAPAANPEAEKAAKIGVGQINKIIPTLRTRDLKSLQANLEKTIASKQKAAPAAPPADAAPAADPAATTAPVTPPPETVAKKSRKKKAAPDQATIDADRDRNIGMTSDSVIRTSASLSETLARKVQEQRQRMFETALMAGTQSVFKK
jgi:pyruvate/2-oxoglutarate dehydrogenase complex dihydrolipoamide acyltransferase (E2) component